MNFSLRPIIRGLAQPRHRLSCDAHLWQTGVAQLRRRGNGRRESGAFLLGRRSGARRRIERFVYYDDLDPRSLDAGIVVFDGAGYGRGNRSGGIRVYAASGSGVMSIVGGAWGSREGGGAPVRQAAHASVR